MLTDRLVGALSFKNGVYAETAKDEGFTGPAWGLIVLTAVVGALVSQTAAGAGYSLSGAIIYSAFFSAGFAFLVFLVHIVSVSFFKGTASYVEMLRAAGLALVWSLAANVFNLLGSVTPVLGSALTCVGFFFILVYLGALSRATSETHGIGLGQAVVAVLVPVIGLVILVFCVVSLFLIAFGGEIGDIFNSILRELQ